MNQGEGWLRNAAGSALYYRSWMPGDEPRAVLVIVHGLAEHSGRYQHFAKYFVDRRLAVFALDHPGHGCSDGPRCHIRRFSEFTEAVGLLLDAIGQSNIPVFLAGHSMGGLIAALFAVDHQVRLHGCILSGAAVKPVAEPPWLQRAAVTLLSRMLPRLRVLGLDASRISRDPAVVERYRNDPLVFTGKISARLAHELFRAMSELEAGLAAIRLPMLILHGSSDGLTDPEGSKILHEHISSPDKKLIVYDGLYHEIYNEPEQDTVLNDVATWLEQRLTT